MTQGGTQVWTGDLYLQSNVLPLSYTPTYTSYQTSQNLGKENPNSSCNMGRENKIDARGHPGLNRGPLDLQSNALPLSYTPTWEYL